MLQALQAIIDAANANRLPLSPAMQKAIAQCRELHAASQGPRADWFREHAAGVSDDSPEIDDGALISEGDDPGAYVMAWVWVPETSETPAKS